MLYLVVFNQWLMMRFIFLSYDAFYFAMHFILIYLRLYWFKALFIQSFIDLRLFIPTPFPIISNNFYPLISNSKNFKQTLSIACL